MGVVLQYFSQRRQPVFFGHFYIHQNDVRPVLAVIVDAFLAVGRGDDNLEVRIFLDHASQHAADDDGIVHQLYRRDQMRWLGCHVLNPEKSKA